MLRSLPAPLRTLLWGVVFFVLWGFSASVGFAVFGDSLAEDDAFSRLWAELIPLAAVMAAHWSITCLSARALWPPASQHPLRDTVGGGGLALLWLGVPIGVLVIADALSFGSAARPPWIGVWLLAAALNVVMQEYLVRGYLFDRIATMHGLLPATVLTTLLFTAMHGFQGGVLGVANVVAASLLFTALRVRTNGLLAPIVAHLVWNVVGGIVLGVISLGGVYPEIVSTAFSGPAWLSGGEARLEGSVVTLAVTLILAVATVAPRFREVGPSPEPAHTARPDRLPQQPPR